MNSQTLFCKVQELLLWLYEKEEFHAYRDFANGMKLTISISGEPVSADPDVWWHWDKLAPNEIDPNSFNLYLEKFLYFYSESYEIPILMQVLGYLNPDGIFYESEYEEKWKALTSAPLQNNDSVVDGPLPPQTGAKTYAKEKENILSIWAGTIKSESYDTFRKEWLQEARYSTLSEDDPRQNMSKFMNEYQTGWFDHDFMEVQYIDSSKPFSGLINNGVYNSQYKDQATQAAVEKGVEKCNVIITLINHEYPTEMGAKLQHL